MLMDSNTINYIEFKARNLQAIKQFYNKCFNWTFTDYGPNYMAFSNSGIEGGFEQTNDPIVSSVLVVLYHDHLEDILQVIKQAGGTISKDIFEFPGGRRFHFLDPSGNELAVWSDK